MGVPRLFPWIKRNFPHLIKYFQQTDSSPVMEVDNLYIDSNGLVHPSTQFIFHYGQGKSIKDKYKDLSYEEKELKSFEHYFNTMDTLVEIVRPKKRLYIAVDGPAPLAKQSQQRERRFSAPSSKNDGFSSTVISPGTSFEFRLAKYIRYAIRKKMNEDPKWKNLDVIFSPPTAPGEGEHTCLDHMRSNPNAEKESNCIFGPDGDLIMLALSAHLPNMYLFRQDQYNTGFYHLLDFGGIRKMLATKMFGGPSKRKLNDVSDDFVLLGFFVGNDFLPKIQMFTYLEDGLEMMISTYRKLEHQNPLVTSGKINHKSFVRFIEEIARREKMFIYDQRKVEYDDPRFEDKTLLSCIHEPFFDFGLYRKKYYTKSNLKVSKDLSEDTHPKIRKMCIDYLKIIAWVFEYYVEGLPSWNDFYPWHYAPLMYDLEAVIKDITEKELSDIYTFSKGEPSLPFVQLLCILPPSSSKLLPTAYRGLMTSKESVLVKSGMYPKKFDVDVDYEGKIKEHMGVVLLPFVDIKLVKDAYKNIKTKDYDRNKKGKDEIYRWTTKYKSKHISTYGTIEENHVKKYV